MADIDCRIVAMFALAMSLVLLGSVIFVRHLHRHVDTPHSSEALVVGRDCSSGVCDEDSEADMESTAAPSPQPASPPTYSGFNISDMCLQCICQVETGCKPKTCTGGVPCGPFRIHKPYWIDAGKLTKDGVLDPAGDSHNEYIGCVNSPQCAARTVSEYVRIFSRDCNGDGVIDCADYMLIHHFGPRGCMLNEDLRMEFMLDQCLLGSPE